MAVTVLSLVMPSSFCQDLPNILLDQKRKSQLRSEDEKQLKERLEEDLRQEEAEEEKEEVGKEEVEEEEDWKTCSDTSDIETEDQVDEEQISKHRINEDIEEEEKAELSKCLLRISPDIFSYQIRTSFVNNKDASEAYWFDKSCRVGTGLSNCCGHRSYVGRRRR